MIVVTGASGLLGATVVAAALQQGCEVVGLYHRHQVNLPGATLMAVDLTDKSETRRIFKELRPANVIHCAAETNVDWCERHPAETHRINVETCATVAEITLEMGARLLYISTDAVFDGTRGPYAETDEAAPLNVYARTKSQGEQEVLRHNQFAAIARTNLYGWNVQSKKSLAEWILMELMLGKVVPGFTDAIFCPILANDLAEVLLAMVSHGLVGLYHVVGSEALSKYEFARRVAIRFGFDPGKVVPVLMAESKLKAPRPRDTSLNTHKICAALGRTMPDVDGGLRKFAQLQVGRPAERPSSYLTGVPE